MPNYRRALFAGTTWFFTVALAERGGRLLIAHIADPRAAIRATRHERPFRIDAMVVLPDHLPAVWTLPQGDADFPTRWWLIKSRFSLAIPRGERIRPSREMKGERGVWQRRYWEHMIRDEADFRHFNPVKHGLVTSVADWPYSTFHRYVRAGIYPPEWAGDFAEAEEFGA